MTFNRLLVFTLLLVAPTLAIADIGPKPGSYECRVDKGYKFRPCTLSVDKNNVTHLEFKGGLVGLDGHFSAIQGSKKSAYFEGSLSAKRPFGCVSCAEKCSEPGADCFCKEIPAEGTAECVAQPMHSVMTKKGNSWKGTLPQRIYSVEYETLKPGQKPQERAVVGYRYDIMLHSFEIRPAKGER